MWLSWLQHGCTQTGCERLTTTQEKYARIKFEYGASMWQVSSCSLNMKPCFLFHHTAMLATLCLGVGLLCCFYESVSFMMLLVYMAHVWHRYRACLSKMGLWQLHQNGTTKWKDKASQWFKTGNFPRQQHPQALSMHSVSGPVSNTVSNENSSILTFPSSSNTLQSDLVKHARKREKERDKSSSVSITWSNWVHSFQPTHW